MNRKVVLIAIVVIAALVIAYNILSSPSKDQVWQKNVVSASYQSDSIQEPEEEYLPSEAEIFIDASESMKPYFRASGADMINTISEIVNLNQESTQIYFIDNPNPYKGLVKDIITDVNKQPSASSTTFHDFFRNAACKIDTVNTLVYLVTDGIMSVGNGDMSKALVELRGKITGALQGHKDLAGAILRYEGDYNGDYWNYRNQRITSKQCPTLKEQIKRPYYVIVLGKKGAIRKLKSTYAEKLNNPKTYFMGVHEHGKATLAYGDSTRIEDMNKDVSLVLELPPCLKDIDPMQVKVLKDGKPLANKVVKEDGKISTSISSSQGLKIKNGFIEISFSADNYIPSQWTSEWNTEDDLNGPDEKTTYGLKYLVTGMFDGLEGNKKLLQADFKYKLQ